MATNGDGSVDQSEFENFFTSQGGTASQADSDFSALLGQGSGNLTATDFSNALTAYQQANSAASPVLSLLDKLAQTGSSTSAI